MAEKEKEVNSKRAFSLRTLLVPSIGAALFYQIPFGFFGIAILLFGYNRASEYNAYILFLSSVLLSIVFFFFIRFMEKKDQQNIYRRKPSRGSLFSAMVIAFGLLGFSFFYLSFIVEISFRFSFVNRLMADYYEMMSYADRFNTVQLILVSITTVLFVPIAEELLFRGIILQEFLRTMKPSVAIVLSSALFAIMHFQIIQVGYAFFCGLIIGAAYYYSKSIYITIIIHIIFNFFGNTFYRMVPSNDQIYSIKFSIETIALFAMLFALLYIRNEGRKKVLNGMII